MSVRGLGYSMWIEIQNTDWFNRLTYATSPFSDFARFSSLVSTLLTTFASISKLHLLLGPVLFLGFICFVLFFGFC